MKENDISRAVMLPGALFQAETNPLHRILVVDDDPDLRRFCAEALAGSGYRVETAEDGAVAWETLQTGVFNLLITDHNMPKLTGVELLQKLHAVRRAIPVIMATGTLPAHEFSRFPWLQPDATLHKPYTTAQLLETVKEVLRTTRGVSKWIAPPRDWQNRPSTWVLET
jgi:two-component system, OmpR family, response regulator